LKTKDLANIMKKELQLYLSMNLPKASLNFQWSQEDNEKFFKHLDENFPKDYLRTKENLLKIKQAFKNHFEKVGYILFTFKNKQIRLKVFPYNIKPQNSKYIDSIIDIIDENDNLIEYDYKGLENQILVKDALINKITIYLQKQEDEHVNKKELIKYTIREAFELEDNDIIMFKQGNIFVKVVKNIKRKQVGEDEKNTIANRYNGISQDELEDFHEEFFANGENQNFFHLVARIFVEEYFHDKKIDNLIYEKNGFAYIQEIILEEVSALYDDDDGGGDDDEFFKGFSGYIFRIHFKEVFGYIADFILIEISLSSSYMSDFLKYYSLNIIVLNGEKYRVPTLDAGNGMRWNVISMLSIAKVYTKTVATIKALKREIIEIEYKVNSLYIGNISPTKYQAMLVKKQNDITKNINKEVKRLEKVMDSIRISKSDDEKVWLNKDLKNIKLEIADLRDDKNFLSEKMIKQSILKSFLSLSKKLDSDNVKLRREESLLKQNEETYLSVKTALINALTSKKQKI